MTWILALLLGYLLGSIPFGIVIARAFGLGDLRKIGSGNIGATNVLRTGHKGAALGTLLLDSGKGAIAVLIVGIFAPAAAPWAGLAAFVGHVYPVWLGFRGGKGVATFLGTMLAMAPLAMVLACATWLAVAVAGRISSRAALAAASLAPVWVALTGAWPAFLPVIAMSALVWWTHRENIARLRNGTESQISFSRR
ncbi:MAG: glycerol-3-phosphate 1-O-acyltransferase PlsY [Pseudomonadota bacterium]